MIISEDEEMKHSRRLRTLMDTVFADVEGDDCDVGHTVAKAYILGHRDGYKKALRDKNKK